MIESKKDGIKIAETSEEALIETTIKNGEDSIRQKELSLELDKVLIQYLKGKREKLKK